MMKLLESWRSLSVRGFFLRTGFTTRTGIPQSVTYVVLGLILVVGLWLYFAEENKRLNASSDRRLARNATRPSADDEREEYKGGPYRPIAHAPFSVAGAPVAFLADSKLSSPNVDCLAQGGLFRLCPRSWLRADSIRDLISLTLGADPGMSPP